jgi:hypothetical protein
MTDEEAFNILQIAEDMSHKNWMHFRLLYNNKFKEAEYRIKDLETALREIVEECQNNPIVIDRMIDRIEETARGALEGEKKDD